MSHRRVSIFAPALLLLSPAQPPPSNLPVAEPNDNRVAAGVLRDRVLSAFRPAEQVVSIGETYDFEFQPLERGDLRIEVRPPAAGRLVARVPVRVE